MPDDIWPFLVGHYDEYVLYHGKVAAQVKSRIDGTVVTAQGLMHAMEGINDKGVKVKFLRGDFYHPVAATPETYRPTDLTLWKQGDEPTTVDVNVEGLGNVARDSDHTGALETGIYDRVTALWSDIEGTKAAVYPSDYFVVTIVSDRHLRTTVSSRALERAAHLLQRLGVGVVDSRRLKRRRHSMAARRRSRTAHP